jgi:hypothetical protein
MQRAELERQLDNVRIPFVCLPVWHRIKFLRKDPASDKSSTADFIHCRPSQNQKQGILPSRFDTALINDGTGEDTGAEGGWFFDYSCIKTLINLTRISYLSNPGHLLTSRKLSFRPF